MLQRSGPVLLFLALGAHFAPAQDAKPVRVGVLGLDNYQAVAYTQLFNDPKASGDLAGLKVVAGYAAPASADIPESVESLPKWKAEIGKMGVKLVGSIDELLASCDAVMIMSLDGRTHLEQARAVLKAKKRLYIGRPLAASLEDAAAILKLAETTKTPCWSSSQHRFSPGFIGMRNHPDVGKVIGCDVYGGCPTEPHHAEFYWHAVHSIETLYTIMGPGCESVRCTSTATAESITGVWKDGRVGTYRGIKKGALKYSATVFGDKGVSTAGVYGHGVPVKGVAPTNDKYMGYEGIAIEMAKFFKGGPAPVSAAETLEIFAFMEAAHESKRRKGEPVRIADVLEKVKATAVGSAQDDKQVPAELRGTWTLIGVERDGKALNFPAKLPYWLIERNEILYGGSALAQLTAFPALGREGAGVAQEDSAVRALIRSAVEARGGKKKLQETQIRVTTVKGTMFDPKNPKLTATFVEQKWTQPGFSRSTMDMVIGEEKFKMIVVVDGEKVWRSINGDIVKPSKPEVTNSHGDQHLYMVLNLNPLLEDPKLKLSAIKEREFDSRIADGIRVESEGKRTVDLYFDHKTHLLSAAVFQVVDLDGTKKEAVQRYYDYRDNDGVKHSMKGTRYLDGQKTSEFEITELRVLDRLPAEVLKSPGKE